MGLGPAALDAVHRGLHRNDHRRRRQESRQERVAERRSIRHAHHGVGADRRLVFDSGDRSVPRLDDDETDDLVVARDVRVLAEHGWPMSRCTASGFAIILRRLTIEYTGSARLEDDVRVRTWASDVRRSMATRHYQLSLVSTGMEVARLRSLYVWVGLERARPIRIPESFLEDFAPNFA